MSDTTPERTRPPLDDDILTETLADWEESSENMQRISDELRGLASSSEVLLQLEYDLQSDLLFANLDMAKVAEMHAANLLAIANSKGSVFSEEEKAMAANGTRMLMGFPPKE